MRATRNRKKEADRAECAADVEQFLAAGGEVQQCDHTHSKWYRDRELGPRKKTMAERSMSIVASNRNPGATPDHIWRNKTDANQSIASA